MLSRKFQGTLPLIFFTPSVHTHVGLKEFTRMLCGPNSRANCLVTISNAAVVA